MTEDTVFDKILCGEIPADIVYESATVLAFKDISPQTKIDKTVNDRTHNIKSCLITIQRVISFGPQSSFEYAIENKAFLATI
mgnify:CR=1 FL=1